MRPLVLVSLLFGVMSGAAHAASTDNLCEGLYAGKSRVGVPQVGKPPFMKYYREPAFGTKVMRITRAKEGEVFKPAYSSMQAWNADESKILLYRGGSDPGHVLLDGETYEFDRDLNIQPADLEEVYWSHTDPDVFFYMSQHYTDHGSFNKYSVKNDKITKIRDFNEICGVKSLPTGGGDVQMQSWDDDLFGFRCNVNNSGKFVMFTYRLSTNEIVKTPIGEDTTQWQQWTAPIPGPSGNQLWYQGKVIDTNLTTVKLSHDMYKHHEHANIGKTHDGNDAVFQTVFNDSPKGCDGDRGKGVGHLIIHDIDTGECRPVINEERGYPYTTRGTHVSAQAFKKPGWVAMSSVGYGSFEYFSNKKKPPALFSEIYLVNTDPDNEVVCRLAHHRSYAKDAENTSYHPYFGEPHATISPSGTRIIFGSDWYASGSVDTYVIELPAYSKTQ